MDQVRKFYAALESDKAMADELKKAFDAAKPETEECAAAMVVKLAAGKGYHFTVEDLRALDAETKRLDKDELDRINAAGGMEGRPTCSLLWR